MNKYRIIKRINWPHCKFIVQQRHPIFFWLWTCNWQDNGYFVALVSHHTFVEAREWLDDHIARSNTVDRVVWEQS